MMKRAAAFSGVLFILVVLFALAASSQAPAPAGGGPGEAGPAAFDGPFLRVATRPWTVKGYPVETAVQAVDKKGDPAAGYVGHFWIDHFETGLRVGEAFIGAGDGGMAITQAGACEHEKIYRFRVTPDDGEQSVLSRPVECIAGETAPRYAAGAVYAGGTKWTALDMDFALLPGDSVGATEKAIGSRPPGVLPVIPLAKLDPKAAADVIGKESASDSGNGSPFYSDRRLIFVRTNSVTREALIEAMGRGNYYTTNGARLLMSFSVSGARMGQELAAAPGSAREIKVEVRGEAPVSRVSVKDGISGLVLKEWKINPPALDTGVLEWKDESPLQGSIEYYAEVTQEDGGEGRSSAVTAVPIKREK